MHLFATGDDRRIYASHRLGDDWSAWSPIGEGTFKSAPAAVMWRGGRLDVFAVGDDRGCYHAFREGDRWSGWQRIGADARFRSAPAVASWGFDRLDLFAVGDDERMDHAWWTPAAGRRGSS